MGEANRAMYKPKQPLVIARASGVLTLWEDKEPLELVLPRYQVPLFPVRYAVGWNGNRTPNIDGSQWLDIVSKGKSEAVAVSAKLWKTAPDSGSPFKVVECSGSGQDTSEAMPLTGDIHYTLRSLRYGYLYAFFEKGGQKVWKIFTRNWFELRPVKHGSAHDPEGGGLSALHAMEAGLECGVPRVQSGPMGMLLVTGEDPVWFAFSEHRWSETVLRNNANDEAFRNRHMRKFDPKRWVDAQKSDHVAPFLDATKWVADVTPRVPKTAFDFSQDAFQQTDWKNQAQGFHDPSLLKRGAILALEDPTGIARDLAWLMMHRYKTYVEHPSYCKPATTIIAIATLEESIKQNARNAACAKYLSKQLEILPEELAKYSSEEFSKRRQARLWEPVSREMPFTSKEDYEKRKAKLDKDVQAPDLDKVSEEAWAEFKPLYKEAELLKWQQEAERKKQAYVEGTIEPIAKVHVAWLESLRLGHVFRYQFDHMDRREAYMDVFANCIENTQGWKPCRDAYVRMLKETGSSEYKKNLVLRALACNDKEILAKLKEARTTNIEAGALALDGWAGVFQTFDDLARQDPTGGKGGLTRVIAELIGALTEHIHESLNQNLVTPVIGMLGGSVKGRRFLGAKLELPAIEAARYVDDHIFVNNRNAGLTERLRAEEVQLMRAGIFDPKTGFSKNLNSPCVILDRGTPTNASNGFVLNKAGELENTVITTREGLESLAQEKWRKATKEVRWQLVASIFQTFNLTKLIQKYHQAKGSTKAEAGIQLALGVSGMACSVAEIAGKVLKNIRDRTIYMGRTFGAQSTKYVGEQLVKWAPRVAVGLAVVAAIPEVNRCRQEIAHDFGKRAFFTGASAASSILAAIFAACALPLHTVVCLAVFAISNIYLALTKRKKITEWLRRCSFGVGSDANQMYATMQQELDALSFAFE